MKGKRTTTSATERCRIVGAETYRVHDALGNWMVEDVRKGRMICLSTLKRDADDIADALRAYKEGGK